jgi:hypothetical protein
MPDGTKSSLTVGSGDPLSAHPPVRHFARGTSVLPAGLQMYVHAHFKQRFYAPEKLIAFHTKDAETKLR